MISKETKFHVKIHATATDGLYIATVQNLDDFQERSNQGSLELMLGWVTLVTSSLPSNVRNSWEYWANQYGVLNPAVAVEEDKEEEE